MLAYSTPQVLTTVMTDPSGHMRYFTLPITVTGGSAELAYTGASVLTPALAGSAPSCSVAVCSWSRGGGRPADA